MATQQILVQYEHQQPVTVNFIRNNDAIRKKQVKIPDGSQSRQEYNWWYGRSWRRQMKSEDFSRVA